jgi:DNA-binding HxlR family transcriptional regulator
MSECVVARIFRLMGKKWVLHIMRTLHLSNSRRFNEMLRDIKGISPRTLSQRLKDLEKEKMIKRQIFYEIPPRVEYSLTENGRKIAGCFSSEGICQKHKSCIFMGK